MKYFEESTMDKSSWPAGPWQDEPDKIQGTILDFPYLIVRNDLGGLCGYIGVSEGHPWFNKDERDVEANVHGGLTYASFCKGLICHVVEPGEDDNIWWLGFDCMHSGDRYPTQLHSYGDYRTVDYVKQEIESLVPQAKEAEA